MDQVLAVSGMEYGKDQWERINSIGPKFEGDSTRAWLNVLDFTSQVWINCEDQVNMYGNPCGSLFANLANGFKDSQAISRGSNTINHPVSIFYSLALEFGKHIDNQEFGRVAAIMTIFFIKWAEYLELNNLLSFNLLIEGFCESLNYVKNVKSSDPMIECLLCGKEAIRNVLNRDDLMMCLEKATSITENFASKRKSSSGCHVVGITFRAIYQALKISLSI